MKHNLTTFSRHYALELRQHLARPMCMNSKAASEVGGQAVGLYIKTLVLARIHEQTLAALELSPSNKKSFKRAESFFDEVNACIEEMHRPSGLSKDRQASLIASLRQRTEELAASNRQLKMGVARRKVMEDEFDKRGRNYRKCLNESLDLQKRLRQLTHQVLSAQEDERKKISRELQDEIAQTLLGINVRLLSIKNEGKNNGNGLKKNIASTRRLVASSVKSVQVVAKRLEKA